MTLPAFILLIVGTICLMLASDAHHRDDGDAVTKLYEWGLTGSGVVLQLAGFSILL